MTGTTTDTGTTTEAVPDPRPGTAPGVVRQTWIITLRDLKHWQREPWTPLFGIAFTIMLVLIFGYLMGGAIVIPGGGDYLPYLLPGMFALAMLFGLESTMSAVTNDAGRGITNRLRSLPISGVAVLGGRAGADLADSAVELAVLMVGGLVVGWRADAGRVRRVRDRAAAVAAVLAAVARDPARADVPRRGGGGRRPGAGLAGRIPLQRPRGARDDAWPAGIPGRVEPGVGHGGRLPGAVRQPDGRHGRALADHAVLLAALWPLVLTPVFVPLSVRAFRRLGG
jgi:ABC-2 type transport system permease protein